MYTEFWGLRKPPFDNVPDPTMYVEAHLSVENTVAETLFAIEEGNECLTVIVGTVGLGKTLSLRMILDLLDHEKYKIAFLTNPDMSFVQLLREIIGQLTGKECDVKGKIELLEVFNKLLFSTADEGKKVLIFIDEANAISPANLESLRLLTNMQDDDRNLFTIVLAGQMEFAKRLEHPARANLFQRIGTYNRIEKMEDEELVKNYVETRLKLAGTTRHIFTDEAIHTLWEYSEHGVPRLVNKIAKLCLKAGETNNFDIITGEIVQQIGDRFDKMTGPSVQKKRIAKTPALKVPRRQIVEETSEKGKPQEPVVIKREKAPAYEPPPPTVEAIPEPVITPQKVEPAPALEPESIVIPQKVEPPPPPPPPPDIPEVFITPQKVEPPPTVEAVEAIPEPVITPQKTEPPSPVEPVPEPPLFVPEPVITLQKVEPPPTVEAVEAIPKPVVTAQKAEPPPSPRPDGPLDWSTLKKIADEFKEPLIETMGPLPPREVAPAPVRNTYVEDKRTIHRPAEKPSEAADNIDSISIAGCKVRIEIPAHIMEQTKSANNEQRRKTAGVLAAQTLEKNPQLTASPTVDPVSVWSEILSIIMKRIER
jgi:type II secretory pathway predicted ATPase ExeA